MTPLRVATWAVQLFALAATIALIPSVGPPGYDEASHGFEALRMAQAVRDVSPRQFFAWFVAPDIYPPLGRVGLALGFLVGGNGWSSPRVASAIAWALTIFLATRLARRAAAPERGDAAAFWTAIFGASCGLGASLARTAYLETWGALMLALASLALLRAIDRGGRARFLAAGLLYGSVFLVKYNYGLFAVASGAATIGWGWLDRILSPERNQRSASWGEALAWSAGTAAVLAWWFVWPWPSSASIGDGHRETFKTFATMSGDIGGLAAASLLIAWTMMSCISLPSFLAQLAGIGWGLAKGRRNGARLASLVALTGFGAYVVYSHREQRFVAPCLFGAWAAGGAFLADRIGRVASPRRWIAGAAALALVLGTAGMGHLTVFGWVMGEPPNDVQRRVVPTWSRPFAYGSPPSEGTPGVRQALDLAARHLDPSRPFAWIGGTASEFSLQGTRWRLAQSSPRTEMLEHVISSDETLMDDVGWNEEQFREWTRAYPQIVVLDPPEPAGRTERAYEERYVEWMARHPDYAVRARETTEREPGERLTVLFYERKQ